LYFKCGGKLTIHCFREEAERLADKIAFAVRDSRQTEKDIEEAIHKSFGE